MKYVLDSSVALKWVLPEVDSGKAIRLRDEYKNAIHQLLAPGIFTPEITNGLAAAERHGRIKASESAVLLLDIATRRAVYDCVYLALAEAEGCELVTADDQFARGLRASFPFIVPLVSLP
jgi:predicted nucleic acid-binding protein